MRLLYLAPALFLAACSGEPNGRVDHVENVIKEISFQGAHQDERCSKGCRYEFVPDTWFIQFCDVQRPTDCTTKKITHAPWSWQKVGTRVTLKWVQYAGGGSTWWKTEGYSLTDTKEAVSL